MTSRLVLAGTLVAFAFCGLLVTAFHAPSPHGIPVGVVGRAEAGAEGSLPAPVVGRAEAGAEASSPARDAFALRRYGTERAARADLEAGELRGVLLTGRLLVAGARGLVEAQAVRAAFPRAQVVDVAPLPAHDSRGLSAVFTALGVTIAGVAFGALLTLLGGAAPLRARLLAIALFGVATGLVVALTVDAAVGALTGAFWAVAAVVALGAAAAGAATHGLGRTAGPPGLALAVVLLVPLGQSAAGGALGADLVPGFLGALAGALPVGATQTALRGAVYFGGAGIGAPLLVLAAWAAAGAALVSRPGRN